MGEDEMTTETSKPVRVRYETDWYDTEDEECFAFQSVCYRAKNQPDIHLSPWVWYDWGKPRYVLVTIEPIVA